MYLRQRATFIKKAVDQGHVFIIMFPLSSGKSWSMFPLQALWPSVPSVMLPIKSVLKYLVKPHCYLLNLPGAMILP